MVIIGSGFGGLNAAKGLNGQDVDITLISKSDPHLFQPLLSGVATGSCPGDIAPTTLRRQRTSGCLLGEGQRSRPESADGPHVRELMDATVTVRRPHRGRRLAVLLRQRRIRLYAGMKTIDDAGLPRGRIWARSRPPGQHRPCRTVAPDSSSSALGRVEGGWANRQLAERTLAGAFGTITPSDCRVILRTPHPRCCRRWSQRRLVQGFAAAGKRWTSGFKLNAVGPPVDYKGTIKEEGRRRTPHPRMRVQRFGLTGGGGQPLGARSPRDPVEPRVVGGRVIVEPDLTVKSIRTSS